MEKKDNLKSKTASYGGLYFFVVLTTVLVLIILYSAFNQAGDSIVTDEIYLRPNVVLPLEQ